MPKRLRNEPIYIAPGIIGKLDDNNIPIVIDEKNNNTNLDPNNVQDKITIFERQVKEWFLRSAEKLVDENNTGFIILMVCLSYFEGIEQYKQGESTRDKSSKDYFINAINRVYNGEFEEDDLKTLYADARCGLFHDGMVKGKVIINNDFEEAIQFENSQKIKINPKKLLKDINNDFNEYIKLLKNDEQKRSNFNRLYSNFL